MNERRRGFRGTCLPGPEVEKGARGEGRGEEGTGWGEGEGARLAGPGRAPPGRRAGEAGHSPPAARGAGWRPAAAPPGCGRSGRSPRGRRPASSGACR